MSLNKQRTTNWTCLGSNTQQHFRLLSLWQEKRCSKCNHLLKNENNYGFGWSNSSLSILIYDTVFKTIPANSSLCRLDSLYFCQVCSVGRPLFLMCLASFLPSFSNTFLGNSMKSNHATKSDSNNTGRQLKTILLVSKDWQCSSWNFIIKKQIETLYNQEGERNNELTFSVMDSKPRGPIWDLTRSLCCVLEQDTKPFHSQDLISNSPYWLLYNSYNFSSDNLLLDQLKIPWLIFLFILITCLIGIVWIL